MTKENLERLRDIFMKLKNVNLKEMSRLVDEGYSYRKLANLFGIGNSTTEGILHGKSKSFTIDKKLTIIKQNFNK